MFIFSCKPDLPGKSVSGEKRNETRIHYICDTDHKRQAKNTAQLFEVYNFSSLTLLLLANTSASQGHSPLCKYGVKRDMLEAPKAALWILLLLVGIYSCAPYPQGDVASRFKHPWFNQPCRSAQYPPWLHCLWDFLARLMTTAKGFTKSQCVV